MSTPAAVFVLRITHRHGTDINVFSTRDKATARVAEYARTYWRELETGVDAPTDDAEVIEKYFEAANDKEYEEYEIYDLDVDG